MLDTYFNGLWAYAQVHWFWGFWACFWTLISFWGISIAVIGLIKRVCRVLIIMVRGWPPAHLNADGDWKPVPKVKVETNEDGTISKVTQLHPKNGED